MPILRLVCLANSRKLGGRCVACLRLVGGGWVRPVSSFSDGTLCPAQYSLDLDQVQLNWELDKKVLEMPV